jgi:hypothetical protein
MTCDLQAPRDLDVEAIGAKAHRRALQAVPGRKHVEPGLDLAAILIGQQLAGGEEGPL